MSGYPSYPSGNHGDGGHLHGTGDDQSSYGQVWGQPGQVHGPPDHHETGRQTPDYSGYGQAPYAQGPGGAAQPLKRPGSVLAGCILAWVGGALGLCMGAMIAAIGGSETVKQELVDQGMLNPSEVDDYINAARISMGILAVWCLAVIVVAAFAFAGRPWAGLTLFVMAAVYVVISLIQVVMSGTVGSGVVGIAWVVLSGVLVYRSASGKAWFEQRKAMAR